MPLSWAASGPTVVPWQHATQACVAHLANIRAFLGELAAAAEDPQRFAAQWHILMKGAIVARHEGDADPALKAREMGLLLLAREGIAAPTAC